MNLSEFKAWFEGFTESMEGPPNAKAWRRIQGRVKEIRDAPPVDRHHFHDYYVNPWWRFYVAPPVLGPYDITCGIAQQQGQNGSVGLLTNSVGLATGNDVNGRPLTATPVPTVFDSSAAFTSLGRAEASSLGNRLT